MSLEYLPLSLVLKAKVFPAPILIVFSTSSEGQVKSKQKSNLSISIYNYKDHLNYIYYKEGPFYYE